MAEIAFRSYIPPCLHIFLPGFLAHSLDILLTVKWMEKLQNNSEIWKKSARDMQQLWVKTHTPPRPTLCSHLLPPSIDNKNNRGPVEKLRCCCRNIPKWWNVFAASWDTRSPYSHALLFKTHYIHTDVWFRVFYGCECYVKPIPCVGLLKRKKQGLFLDLIEHRCPH